jgi:hypothetical protein
MLTKASSCTSITTSNSRGKKTLNISKLDEKYKLCISSFASPDNDSHTFLRELKQ